MAEGHVWQGCMCGRGACVAGGHEWQGGMHGGGACMAGGHTRGKREACVAGKTAIAVGMHSCLSEGIGSYLIKIIWHTFFDSLCGSEFLP